MPEPVPSFAEQARRWSRIDTTALRPVVVGDAELEPVGWQPTHGYDASTGKNRLSFRVVWRHASGRTVAGPEAEWFDSAARRDHAACRAYEQACDEQYGRQVERIACDCGAGLGEEHADDCRAVRA